MRNLKRSLAIFIVFALVTSIMLPAFAQDYTYSDEFDTLYQLGLIDGTGEDSDGNPVPSLDDELTRETGVAMLVKMFVGSDKIDELEAAVDTDAALEEAKDMLADKFEDADDVSDWAAPYLAYALSEEMIEGRPVEDSDMMELAPGDNLSGRDFATMFLRQLGYEITGEDWEEACFTLQEKGGLTEEEAEMFNTKSLIRNDMVGIAFGTLFAENSDGKTLINYLVETAKVVDGEKALELGVVYKAIKSVKAPDDVSVELDGTPEMPATVEVTFEDDTTAEIPVKWDSVDTSEEGTFDVKAKIPTYADGVTVKVTVQPKEFVVNEVTATNLKEIEVKFNRMVDEDTAEDEENYTGGFSTPTSATLQEDGKTVILLSAATLNANQSYTLTVSDVEDSAGNVIEKSSTAFTPSDKSVPQIESVTAKGNSKVVVLFTEPVKNADEANKDNFKVDGYDLSSLPVAGNSPEVASDLKTVTITTDAPLLAGKHVLTLSQGGTDDITDYAGYAAAVSAHEFEVTNDTTIPEVKGVTADSQTEVTIEFSEEMTNLEDELSNFYWNTSGLDTDNSRVADKIEENDDDTWTATYTTNYLPAGQSVYFFVKDAKDLSNNNISGNYKANIERTEITVPTNEVPTVDSVTSESDKQIDILFTDVIDKDTAEDESNYSVKESDGTSKTFTATIDNTSTSSTYMEKVSLTFSSALDGGTYTVETKTGLEDVVGNSLEATSNTVVVGDSTQPSTATAVIDTSDADNTYVVVTFEEDMSSTGENSATDISNYRWDDNGSVKELPSGTYITALSSQMYKMVFDADTIVPADSLQIGYYDGSELNTVADSSGNLFTPATVELEEKDTIAFDNIPSVEFEMTDKDELELTLPDNGVFNNAFSTILYSDFTIMDSIDGDVTPSKVELSADGKVITFTVSDEFSSGSEITLKINSGATGIKDVFDNEVAAAVLDDSDDNNGTELAADSIVGPKLLTFAVKDDKTVILKLDGEIKDEAGGSSTIEADKLKNSIRVVQDDDSKAIADITRSTYSDSEFTLDLSGDEIDSTEDITVKTLSEDYITAQDNDGNKLSEDTTGITSNELAAYKVTSSYTEDTDADDTDKNDLDENTLNIHFNKVVDPSSIKSGWNGSLVDTVTADIAGGVVTIDGYNFGTLSGTGLADASDVEARIQYSSEQLIITLESDAIDFGTTKPTSTTFKPNSSIITSSGNSINTDFTAVYSD